MGTATPKIHASVHIPTVMSFSDKDEPSITLSLVLHFPPNYPSYPITIYRPGSDLNVLQNTLPIHNTRTGDKIFGHVDVCMRRSSNVRLAPSQESRFITLKPGEPHIITCGFRPFGHKVIDWENIASLGEEKYGLACTWGMHKLRIGEEYRLGVAESLMVHEWMIGDKEGLFKEEGRSEVKWERGGSALNIIPGKSFRFRVEE